MQKLTYLFCFLYIKINEHCVISAVCNAGDYTGENNVQDEDKHLDSSTGISIMLEAQDNQYTFSCCGYIQTWEYYSKDNTGTVYFQVWRDTTASISTWTLVGENMHTHSNTAGNTYQFVPATADRILVQSGDEIGLHFPGSSVVTYDNGHQYRMTSSYTTGSTNFDWSSISTGNNRDYAVKALLEPSASPTIDNLDSSVTFSDGTNIGTLLFTLTVSDSDASDTLTTTVTSNSAPTLFDFNSATLEVTSKAALSSGTYTMAFQVADLCSLTDTGTLTITITNVPPTINNLPGSYYLSEDQTAEMLLYTVNATDPSDSVSCSISNTNPAAAPFTVKTDNGIYVQSSPGLDYDVTPQYILTIQCTDTKDPVSDIYTIYIVPNLAPTIHNLPSSYILSEDQEVELLLYTLNVTDPTNEVITCSVTNPASSPFFMKPVSGTSDYGIYVQHAPNLDYDLLSQYDLTIECADSRTPVTGLYTVTLLKNNAPVFTNLNNATSISTLTSGIGDLLFQVSVADAENDQLLFNMTCNPSVCPFSIFASGDIQLTNTAYGTSVTNYDLYINVFDGHTLVGPKLLSVGITDINYSPSFTNLPTSSTLIVYENSALGTSVYQVGVSDPNTYDNHVYTASYNPASGTKYFKLNSATGLLTTSKTNTIDYEQITPTTTFTVNVSVSDGFSFISETLDILIADVNEAPEFQKSFYSVSGNEDNLSGVKYDTGFIVDDPDSGSSHIYTMDCGTYQAYFTMESTSGNVTFVPGYDLDTGINPEVFTCNVTVSDGEFTDISELEITVNQINDNLPQFTRPTYTFYISADDGIGTTVGMINVTDQDIGTHGTVSYSLNLTSITCDCLAITDNGEIYVVESLSAFSGGTVFNIKAIATDGGNLQSTADVSVVILPIVTTVSTTTTDRYITFWEDARNSIWVVLAICALIGWLCLMAYFTYSFGWLDGIFEKCTKCAQKRIQRRAKPIQRAPRLQPVTELMPTPEPDPIPKIQWEPWRTKDFINSSFS